MSAWWWTAVVVLLAGAFGLAWYELGPDWLRKDDDGKVRDVLGTDADPGRVLDSAGLAGAVEPAVSGESLRVVLPAKAADNEALDAEPTDGDAYAAELHAIGQAAGADDWDPVASLRQMCPYVRSMGFTPEDWHDRLMGMSHADYMAELDRAHRARLERWGAEQAAWKARQLRGIRRYRGLGAAA